jgi:hypothetical protein
MTAAIEGTAHRRVAADERRWRQSVPFTTPSG